MREGKCVKKINNKQGKIENYIIQIEGKQLVIPVDSLKREIKQGNIVISNLTLTKDNRLLPTNRKNKETDVVLSKNEKSEKDNMTFVVTRSILLDLYKRLIGNEKSRDIWYELSFKKVNTDYIKGNKNIRKFVLDSGESYYIEVHNTVISIISEKKLELLDGLGLFEKLAKFVSINLSNIDTSKVKTMARMFKDCSGLKRVNLGIDTSNVIDMQEMFSGCISLGELDLHTFNTEKVEDMSKMFAACTELKRLDLKGFNTRNVKYFSSMFEECDKLREIDLSSFSTESVRKVDGMFRWCSELKELDLNNFNTTFDTEIAGIFYNCEKLENLNICGFAISMKSIITNAIFKGCNSLKFINMSKYKYIEEQDKNNMKLLKQVCKELKEIKTDKVKLELQ